MTRRPYIRLQAELAGLRSHLAIEVPDEFMDYDDNLVAEYAARQARIGQVHDMLANAIAGEDPPDDGVAEPGMVLTVRYDDTGDTGDTETVLLGVRAVEDADIEVYSAQSPLGSVRRCSTQCLTGCSHTNTFVHSRFDREAAASAVQQPPSLAIETRIRKTVVRGCCHLGSVTVCPVPCLPNDNHQYPTCRDITTGL